MLKREYGIATPSPLAAPIHPEDAQPNEAINKRAQKLPPAIRPTAPPVFQSSSAYSSSRGGFRGTGWNVSQRGQFTQQPFRGNSPWRGRGGGYSSWKGERRPEVHFSLPSGPLHSDWTNSPPSNSHLTENGSANQLVYGQRNSKPPSGPSTTFSTPTGPLHSQPPSNNWPTQRPRSPLPSYTPTSPRFKRRKLEQRSQSDLLGHPEDEPKRSVLPNSGPLVPSTSLPPSNGSVPGRDSPPLPLKKEPLPVPIPPPALTLIKTEDVSPIKVEVTSTIPHAIPANAKVKTEEVPPTLPVPTPSSQPCSQPPASVKQERLSPSPPPERRLITESCNFYPFPERCKKSHPNFRENRRAFFLEKNRVLAGLGLKKTKVFSRDDGLVIEWTSKVPVWSDTFRPDRSDDFADVIEISD